MGWLQLGVITRYPDFAEEILTAHGAVSVSLLPTDDSEPLLEPAPGETPLWTQVQLQALFDEGTDTQTVERTLRSTLPDGDTLQFDEAHIADSDWVRNCLDSLQSMRFGERLWIRPHNREVTATDAVVVTLDPGLAFGTGTHQTTALCLRWLDSHLQPGARVLDYGCGSGILAVAAAKLGAAAVVAVDNDPQALRATQENARINDVTDTVSVCAPDDFTPEVFDVVLANILAAPLVALAPRLRASCRSGGHIVLAGLLDWQEDEVRAAYPDFQLQAECDEGWTRLSGKKAGAD